MRLNMMKNMFGIEAILFVAFSDGMFFYRSPSDSRWAIMLVAFGDKNQNFVWVL